MRELAYERGFRRWAEARGMAWERFRYPRPEAGGETLAYRVSPPTAPRGVVLAVHGAGNDALFSLVGLFKALLLSGLEVFSFDVDGHGRGSTTIFHPGTVSGAVPAAVEHSRAGQRGLPLHALGISLGGALLLGALPDLAERAASASLMVAPLRIQLSWGGILNEVGLPALRTVWREREHCGIWGQIPSFGPVKRSVYPLRLGGPTPPGAFGYVEVLNRTLEGMRLEEAARRTRTRSLLVYGGADRLVPPEQGERLARLIPRAELLRLPGETHLTTPLAPAAVERTLDWVEERGSAEVSHSRSGGEEGAAG